jgi:nucleotide-binding universal stress UspA family protein
MHKPVLNQTLLGGVVHEVMNDAVGTVAVYLDRGHPERRRVLVPFQGSRHDRAAAALAARVQQSSGCEITILHVLRSGGRSAEVRTVVDSFADTGGTVLIETVEHRSPAAAAIERAAGYDLVIVGAGEEWGLGGRPLGIGLQPERLIRDCPTSLLVVRGPREKASDASPGHVATARIASE